MAATTTVEVKVVATGVGLAAILRPLLQEDRHVKTKQKVAIAKVLSRVVRAGRSLAGRPASARCRRHGVNWTLDLTQGIDLALYLGVYERSTYAAWRRLVRPGDHIVDIGANIGAHALVLANLAGPHGRLAAIEPTDYGHARMAENLAANAGLGDRVTPVRAFLAESQDVAPPTEIYASWPLGDGEAVHPDLCARKETLTATPTRTVDSIMADLAWTRLDLVKIDIDGAECGALRGAGETLSRFKPTIVIELAPYLLEQHGGSIEELMALLSGHGYRFETMETGAALTADGAELRRLIGDGASINAICRAR